MNSFQALQRLRAWKEGRPLPRGETVRVPLANDEDTFIVAFVRMGGESAPWGVAFGQPGKGPRILSVSEPRNRDLVAGLAAELAPHILAQVFHPEFTDIQVFDAGDPRPMRQIWLPNGSHPEMLHHLAYAYTFAKRGDPERVRLLNMLGRAAGWLFREYNRPGQCTVMAANEALRLSYTFPCEDVRQGHLGFLLAWLETRGSREKRVAAAARAEERSISTSLSPALERDELAHRVDRLAELRHGGRGLERRRLEAQIARVLEAELEHRFALTERTIAFLRADGRPVNHGLDELIRDGSAPHWWGYLEAERNLNDDPGAKVFVSGPETDRNPRVAAALYFDQQNHAERSLMLLLENDQEMQAEAVAAGEAIHGTIDEVRDEGRGRATIPVWEVSVEGEAPTKIKQGTAVFVVGTRSRKGRIREIQAHRGSTIYTVEIVGLKTTARSGRGALHAADSRLTGRPVTLLPAGAPGIQYLKRAQLHVEGAPGAWLTDSRPPARFHVPPEVTGPDGDDG